VTGEGPPEDAVRARGIWDQFTIEHGLPDMKIESLYQDSRGRLWVGTHDRGVAVYDGTSFERFSVTQGLSGNGVYAIAEDRLGRIWLATNRGLTSFEDGEFCSHGESVGFGLLWGCENTRDGRLWFGMERRPGEPPGVLVVNPRSDGDVVTSVEVTNLSTHQDKSIHSIAEDSDGLLWLGGDVLWVSREPISESVLTWRVVGSFKRVRSVVPCRGGVLVGDHTGLWIVDDEGARLISRDTARVNWIAEGGDDVVYAGSESGDVLKVDSRSHAIETLSSLDLPVQSGIVDSCQQRFDL
jgi:hypothetical protein